MNDIVGKFKPGDRVRNIKVKGLYNEGFILNLYYADNPWVWGNVYLVSVKDKWAQQFWCECDLELIEKKLGHRLTKIFK